jgi:hypothetical protein
MSLLLACSQPVAPDAILILAITPVDPTMAVNERVTFTATVNGEEAPDVIWSAVCGEINDAGEYIAPDTPTPCTIRASSRNAPSVAAEVVVTITPPPTDPDGFNARYTVDATCATAITASFPTSSTRYDAGANWSQRFLAEAGFTAQISAETRCEASIVTVSIWRWEEGRWVPVRAMSSSGDFAMTSASLTF